MNDGPYAAWSRFYLGLGWSPIPVAAGRKAPPETGWTGRGAPYPSAADVEAWCETHGHHNVALRLQDGVLGLDVDLYGEKSGRDTMEKLIDECGPLPPAPYTTSRNDDSGIRLFRVFDRRRWVGQAGPNVEIIQASHRYVMVEPSIHPEGARYRWVRVKSGVLRPVDLPWLPMRWQDRLTLGDADDHRPELVSVEEARSHLRTLTGSPCPAMTAALDDTRRHLDAGSRHDATRAGVMRAVRLGEQGHQGAADAVGVIEGLFDTAIAGDRTRPVDPHEFSRMLAWAVAEVRHDPTDDDDLGCCPGWVSSGSVSLVGTHTHNAQNADSGGIGYAIWGESTSEWPTPRPLSPPLPTLTPEMLPAVLRPVVTEVARATQTPTEFGLVDTLAVLSAATRGRWTVAVRPQWSEALSLYTVAVAVSGTRKTAVDGIYSRALAELEQHWQADAVPLIAEAKAQREALEAEYKALIHQAGSRSEKVTAAQRQEATANASSAARQLAEIVVPAEPRILTEDASPERLALIMAEQDGTIAVLSAEGTLLNVLTGRYSDSPNVDVALKAHSGEQYRVDRVNRASVLLPRTHLAIGLGVQPVVLEKIPEAVLLERNGFLARWLYLIPANRLGTRDLNPTPADPRILAAWDERVTALATYAQNSPVGELRLSAEATAALDDYRADHERRLHPDLGDLAAMTGWGSKLLGLLIRIAALTTLGTDPYAIVIGPPAMTEALSLEPVLVAHARAAFGLIHGTRLRADQAAAALRWIERRRLVQFTGRDAWQGLRGQTWAERADDVTGVLAVLADHDWIARLPDPQPPKPGRPPSPTYLVSPYLTGRYQQEVQ